MAIKIKTMKTFVSKLIVMMIASMIVGCGSVGSLYSYKGSGFLYTHKIEPLTHHYYPIQTGQTNRESSGHSNMLSFETVTLVWGDNAIGEIAKKSGIQTVYYADLETQSILFGLWTRNKIHIYGTAEVMQDFQPNPEN
jgi:TRL (tRNA-associated locus)-like protein